MPGGELPLKNDEYINDAPENVLTLFDSDDNASLDTVADAQDASEKILNSEAEHTDSPAKDKDDAEKYTDSQESYIDTDADFDAKSSELVDGEADDDDGESSEISDGTDGEDYNDSDDGTCAEDKVIAQQDPTEPINNKKSSGKNEVKERKVDSLFDFIEIFVFTLAAVFIITSFFFRYSLVKGDSMQNTLQDQERLLLTNFLYNPKPGDIVVIQDKSTVLRDKDPIVKRVIAVGGQKVKFTKNAVYVDGEQLVEDYVYTGDHGGKYEYSIYPSEALLESVTDYKIELGVSYEITVPENEIFVMGDHRNDSTDSRSIGTLHEDAIIGKVVLRFYPFENFGKVE